VTAENKGFARSQTTDIRQTGPGRKTGRGRARFVQALLLLSSFCAIPLPGQGPPELPYGRVVKEIRFVGLKRAKEFIVARELATKAGAPLLEKNIIEDRQRLEKLDVFVDIRVESALDGDMVILTYRFVETFGFMPSVGVQITDENGLSAGLGVKIPNLFGRNISFSSRVMGGGSTLAQLTVEDPWFLGNRIGYQLGYFYRDRDNLIGGFHEFSHEFNLDVGGPWGRHGRFGGFLEYMNVRSDVAGVTLSPDNHDEVTRLGAFIMYDSRNAIMDTRRGWWLEARFNREVRIFNNSSDFYQLDLDARRYQPLPFGDRHQLAIYSLLSLRTGTVGVDVASWQLFGMGGTNTVRGWEYAYQKGKNQFIGTLEYSFTVLKPRLLVLPFKLRYRGGLQLCAFADTGLAWSEAGQFALDNFISGYGVGVRVLVPVVGMLRLDLGWGETGKGVAIHIGSYEKPVMSRRRVR
jgi:outer membrane protein assembly factor BamA